MHLYIASVTSTGLVKGMTTYEKLNEIEKQISDTIPNTLESYHYVHTPRLVNALRNNKSEVFLDSGAFSAFTLGTEINIDDYCTYCQVNDDIIKKDDGVLMASVLDGIGDAQKTLDHQAYMEKKGVRPLPCFHFGEDPAYLEYYIERYEYITIGGMVGRSGVALRNWLDNIWQNYLVDGSGRPRLKVHAFGITSVDIMGRYPWYSVDSSTWAQAGAFGDVVVEGLGRFAVSSMSPNKRMIGQHLCNYTEPERKVIIDKLEQMGFNEERLGESAYSRFMLNIKSFNDIAKTITANPDYKFQQTQGLFD